MQQLYINNEMWNVNDDLAVKREEGFIRCSHVKLDHGEYRKKLNQLIMINVLKSYVIPVQFENDYSFE